MKATVTLELSPQDCKAFMYAQESSTVSTKIVEAELLSIARAWLDDLRAAHSKALRYMLYE